MTRITLVEDDDTMRSLLKTLLELEGFQVSVYGAQTEDDILNGLKEVRPQAVLLDVHLRKTNGLHILQRIRQEPELQSLPVAMISGEDLAGECLSAGADKFILKPFDTTDLIGWLHSSTASAR